MLSKFHRAFGFAEDFYCHVSIRQLRTRRFYP